jgi:hypothetical protein
VDQYGGIWLAIVGSQMQTVASVGAGGVPCTDLELQDRGLLFVRTPPLVIGSHDVLVTFSSGEVFSAGSIRSWYPTQIASCRLYDSERGVTGSPVSLWADQGSGAKDLSQATLLNRPAYADGRLSGRHALVWDGVRSDMALAASIGFTKRSVFWVSKHTFGQAGIAESDGFILGGDAADLSIQAIGFLDDKMRLYDGDGPASITAGSLLNDGSPRVFGYTHDGDGTHEINFYVNGVQQGPTLLDTIHPNRASWDRVATTSGVGAPFFGEIGMLFVIEGVLSASDVADLSVWGFGKFCARDLAFMLEAE